MSPNETLHPSHNVFKTWYNKMNVSGVHGSINEKMQQAISSKGHSSIFVLHK